MASFLANNRKKLGFAFIATSLIFLSIVFILLIIGYYNNQMPDIWLLLIVILSAGLVFPAFIVGLAYLNWLYITRIRKKIYELSPFDKLDEIGFAKSFISNETKWHFTEEIKTGLINEFEILCNAEPKLIEFIALTNPLQLKGTEYKKLRNRLKKFGIYFSYYGIAKQYRLRQMELSSLEELKKDLYQFTDILKQESIKPRIKNGRA
jgi:hypothetical protein